MAYDPLERSNYDGKPIDLYEFSLGSTTWRYAAAKSNVTVGGQTYTAMSIGHDGYSVSGDPDSDELTITISRLAPMAEVFFGTPPSQEMTAKIIAHHRGDDQTRVVWSGLVKSAKDVSAAELQLRCNSILSTLNRNGLRLAWGRNCPHVLYDLYCRVDPNDYGVTGAIVSLPNAVTVRAPFIGALPNNYLAGGYLLFAGNHGVIERRPIETHAGQNAGLLGTADGISPGTMVTVYPGCNRITQTCINKFNNLSNFGGFPHLPTKSPFDGSPIF